MTNLNPIDEAFEANPDGVYPDDVSTSSTSELSDENNDFTSNAASYKAQFNRRSSTWTKTNSMISYGADENLESQLNLSQTCRNVDKINRDVGTMKKTAKVWSGNYWFAYIIWPLIAIIIQLFFGLTPWWLPDDKSICTDGTNRDVWICDLVEALEDGTNGLTFLSAFIVGGFVISSVNIWLGRRSSYRTLCGATRDVLVNINSIVPNQKDRLLMTRWTIIAYELSMLQARELINSEAGRTYLEELNLLHTNEWETMIEDDRQGSVCFWIQAKAAKLAKSTFSSDRIEQLEFQTICGFVSSFRAKGFDMMGCISKDQPTPYVFVCACLINLNLAFHAVTNGFKWAIWLHNAGAQLWSNPSIYVSLFSLFAYSTMYAMLFDICAILYNPYGGRDIDIGHRAISASMRQFAKGLYKGDLPEPETQMEEGDYENDASMFVGEYSDINLTRRVPQKSQSVLHFKFND